MTARGWGTIQWTGWLAGCRSQALENVFTESETRFHFFLIQPTWPFTSLADVLKFKGPFIHETPEQSRAEKKRENTQRPKRFEKTAANNR
jgi:hypothetical protein